MSPRLWLRAAAASVLALLLTSCLSVQTNRHPSAEVKAGTGGVALRVFADDSARRAGQPGPRGLFVELERQEGKRFSPVFRSLEPAWSVLGLPPGDYRVRFTSRLNAAGEAEPLEERSRTVKVRAGEVTEVDAVLEHVDKGLVVVGVVAAVVAAVLLHDWLDDLELPMPPLPPPPHEVFDAIFWVSLDIATSPHEPWAPVGPSRPPVVTSVFPPGDALVTVDRVRVTFALSEPLDPERFADDCIEVVGNATGAVPGTTRYDPERWWAHWYPAEDLPRDDRFAVTLFADCVHDLRGNALELDERFSFRTAP